LNSNFDPGVNGNDSAALVYLGGVATLALTGLLVWLVITEIGRAQRRAGIDVTRHVTLHEVLLAKIGIGLEDPTGPPTKGFLDQPAHR
jgi:hypothetical protein